MAVIEANGATAPQVPARPSSHHRRQASGRSLDDDDESVKPLPERLVIELTAHRTIALLAGRGRQSACRHDSHFAASSWCATPSGIHPRRAWFKVSVLEVYCRERGVDLQNSPMRRRW